MIKSLLINPYNSANFVEICPTAYAPPHYYCCDFMYLPSLFVAPPAKKRWIDFQDSQMMQIHPGFWSQKYFLRVSKSPKIS